MPKNTYMVVTNDELETIVASGLSSKETAKFLGIALSSFYCKLGKCKWSERNKYKVIIEDVAYSGYETGRTYSRCEYMQLFRKFVDSDKDSFVYECETDEETRSGAANIRWFLKRYKVKGIKVYKRRNLLICEREI